MMKAYYQIENFGEKGIRRTHKRRSKSFVKQFINVLYAMHIGSHYGTNIDNGQSLFYISYCTGHSASGGYIGMTLLKPGYTTYYSSKVGIMLGTDSSATVVTQYQMVSPITFGVGASKLEYIGTMIHNLTINTGPNTGTFDVVGYYRNSSGGTINISEIGVYCVCGYGDPALIMRDVVSPAQAVLDTEYLKVTYTIQITS